MISRLHSLEHPVEIEEGMVFALETYCPARDGRSAARIEEEVLVTSEGNEILTRFPAQELLVTGTVFTSVAPICFRLRRRCERDAVTQHFTPRVVTESEEALYLELYRPHAGSSAASRTRCTPSSCAARSTARRTSASGQEAGRRRRRQRARAARPGRRAPTAATATCSRSASIAAGADGRAARARDRHLRRPRRAR